MYLPNVEHVYFNVQFYDKKFKMLFFLVRIGEYENNYNPQISFVVGIIDDNKHISK